jgi:hypothetical protein
VPNLKLRHKHRAAHPNIDPSSVPSLPLSLHTLSVQTHTRFKLKIGIEIEPEPMELPECKAGSDWQVQNREQKEGEKEELKCGRADMCRPWRSLDAEPIANWTKCGVASRNCDCVFQRHRCQPGQTRRRARRAKACAEQPKASSAGTQPVEPSMILGRQTRCGPA